MQRNKNPIYIAKRLVTEDGIEVFSPPVLAYANPMPMSADYQQALMGMVESGTMSFVVDKRDNMDVALGDRIYVVYEYDKEIFHPYIYDDTYGSLGLYGISYVEPYGFITVKEFDGTAQDADYRIVGISSTPNVMRVVLERMNV